MKIQVLGTGCTKCKTLEQRVKEVVLEESIQAEITKVEDIVEIMKFGVMSTPALVFDDKVVMSGSLPSKKEIAELIKIP
jgi:small redox-active disulfide protein 2